MLFLLNLFKNLNLCTSYIKQIMNVFSFVQWNKYFHSVKDEMYHSTRLRLVEWNISSFTSWKYLYHCTHKHSLFVYWITMEYAVFRMKIETLRFLRLNESNVSLVAICAVILVKQRAQQRSNNLPWHEMRQVYQSMTRGRLYRFFFYVVVITKSSRYVLYVKHTLIT